MKVSLLNDGPVTIIIDSKNKRIAIAVFLAKALQLRCIIASPDIYCIDYHLKSVYTFMLQTAEDIRQLNERIQAAASFVDRLEAEISKVIVGQHYTVGRLLIGLLSNGHVLLEGVPSLAKTLSIKSLAQAVMPNSAVYSLRLICYLPMLSAP